MTSPLDVVFPDEADASDDLIDEFARVRETLRSNLVPEAWKLGALLKPDELKQAPLVWLLACGPFHDHLAYAAVAAALKHAGYRVQVFGVASSASIFARLGIPFEAHDAHVLTHRNNRKGRTWLQMLSTELGFEGPDKEADFLLDLHLLRQEFSIGISVKTAFDGNINQLGQVTLDTERRFNDLFYRSDCSEKMSKYIRDRYSDVTSWRAQERRMSVENFAPVRRTRAKAFRDFLRQKAREEGCDPIDLAETLRHEMVKRMSPKVAEATKEGKDVASVLLSEVIDFLGWLAGKSPREWWADWTAKLEGWREALPTVRVSQSWVPSAMYNLKFTMEDLEPSDRPNIVLYRWDMVSVALMLEAECKVKTCVVWPFRPALSPYHHLMLYCGIVLQESREAIPCTPVSDMGPLAFSAKLWGHEQLIGASPLSLKDSLVCAEIRSCPLTLKAIRERTTGLWCLDAEPTFLAPEDVLFFGSEGERQRAFAFLADSSDPPVCMCWGKHVHPRGAAALAKLVACSLQLLGRRGVFIVGQSGASLDHLQTDGSTKEDVDLAAFAERQILFLKRAPHNWLFPRCTCVAHHGGPGTTQAALRAGVPQAIIKCEWPFSNTSQASSDLVRLLGCGMEGAPLVSVTPALLAETMRLLHGDAAIKARVADVAKSMQRQPGVLGTVALVSHLLQEKEAPQPAPVAEADMPWRDGLWAFYSNGTLVTHNLIHGGGFFDKQGVRRGWARHGSFRTNDMSKLPAGHSLYTVQAFFPDIARLSYGIVSSDGKKITWDSANTLHLWESDAPPPGQEERLLLTSPWRLLTGFVSRITGASQEAEPSQRGT